MSGGVDSTIAAARLIEAGYDVVGATLQLWDMPNADGSSSGANSEGADRALEGLRDAQRVAAQLAIPHHVRDCRQIFRTQIIDDFVDSYVAGRTPSPCVWCNPGVKIRQLLLLADQLGAEGVATGHYARIQTDEAGQPQLWRGRDPQKDQSYFLYRLTPEQLGRLTLPLGDSLKREIRAEASARKLVNAASRESQELCFLPSLDYVDFVGQRGAARLRPGPLIDRSGRELGQHTGIHRFTIGQRKGLGVSLGRPAYVVDICAATATVTLGEQADLYAAGALLHEAIFREPRFPLRALVKIRSQHPGAMATLCYDDRWDDRSNGPLATVTPAVVARFDEPVRAVCPGQAAVAYDGQRVLGGATIGRALTDDELGSLGASGT